MKKFFAQFSFFRRWCGGKWCHVVAQSPAGDWYGSWWTHDLPQGRLERVTQEEAYD